jgi:pantothenate kinase
MLTSSERNYDLQTILLVLTTSLDLCKSSVSLMEEVYASLTARALDILNRCKKQKQHRTIIVIAGPPGSGKSTIAEETVRRINETTLKIPRLIATILPMDGFHLSQKELDALPNRSEAYERRGAAWTFNADGVLELVQELHRTKHQNNVIVKAPSFHHKVKDPVKDSIVIDPSVDLVIMEGNWLLYEKPPWNQISGLADDTWFVDVDPLLARDRVARRHLKAGIEDTWDAALKRASGNDLRNGEEVRRKLVKPAIVVRSVEERPATESKGDCLIPVENFICL